jgi:hypothetical protein
VATRSKMSAHGIRRGQVARWANALTVDERVENAHGPVADTGVGVDLLENCDARQNELHATGQRAKNSPL